MTIDVIILSNTANISYYNMLKRCVETLKESEDVNTNIIVVETNKKLKEKLDQLKLPVDEFLVPNDEKFNFNRYLNYGLDKCKNDYICLSNNDVFYKKDTLKILAKYLEKYDSVSPWDELSTFRLHPKKDIYEGYCTRYNVTGWCIMTKKNTFDIIGKFDERFSFWFADDDYSKMLQTNGLKHALIGEASVEHLCQQSHDLWDPSERYYQTDGLGKVFEEKWNKKE